MRTKRIPLVGEMNQRLGSSITTSSQALSTTKDLILRNCYVDKTTGVDGDILYAVKRPGSTLVDNETDGQAAGIYFWKGRKYVIIENTLYKDGVSISTSISVGGRAYFTEQHVTDLLVILVGQKIYTVDIADNVTELSDGNIPTSIAGGIVSLNKYICVMDPNGIIYNSNVDDVANWTSGDSISCLIEPDDGIAIAKYKNYIVGLGQWTTEVFYDASNPSGSPLDTVEGSVIDYGCVDARTVFADEENLIWVAQSRNGAPFVGQFKDMSVERLSHPPIDKTIEDNITAIALNAVNFDGSNDYLTRGANLTGAADGKLGTVSFWIKTTGTSRYPIISMEATIGTASEFNVIMGTSGAGAGKITIYAQSALDIDSSIAVNDGNWHHVVASWDLGNTTSHLYIDGVDRNVENSASDATIDYTEGDFSIGAYTGGSVKLPADLAQVYVNTAEYVDLSVAANLAKFYNGGAVDFGSDGSTPTGTQPIVFLNGVTSSWHTNLGTGGGLTENGALTSSESNPSSKNIHAFGLRVQGHLFYCLYTNINNDWCLVCDVETKLWYIWDWATSAAAPYDAAYDTSSSTTQVHYVGKTDGSTYKFDPDVYQDNSQNITYEVITDKVDLQTSKSKFLHSLRLLGDEQTSTSNISVSYTDDDYQNFSTSRTLDMSKTDPVAHALGRFKRRAFKVSSTANTPIRLEGLELGFTVGDYEGGNV